VRVAERRVLTEGSRERGQYCWPEQGKKEPILRPWGLLEEQPDVMDLEIG